MSEQGATTTRGGNVLLTEEEAAARLGCSTSKTRKLRYAGRLAYIPGKPVLILERDLVAFEQLETKLKAAAIREKQIKKGRYREPKPEPLTGQALILYRVKVARLQRTTFQKNKEIEAAKRRT